VRTPEQGSKKDQEKCQ